MTAVDIEQDPITWDMVVLGGHATPGVARLSGSKALYKWDSKAGVGKAGASTVFTGQDLPSVTVRLSFADGIRGLTAREQRREWKDRIVPILQRSADGKTAIDFYHPQVSDEPIGLRSVVTKSIGPIEYTDNGSTSVEFELLAYRKPKAARVGSPSGSRSNSANGSVAKDETDAEIEALTQQLQDAAAGADSDLGDLFG